MTRVVKAVVMAELFKGLKSELNVSEISALFPISSPPPFFIIIFHFCVFSYFCGEREWELPVVQADIYEMSHRIKPYITF